MRCMMGWAGLVMIGILAGSASFGADRVTLRNGDVLSGEVVAVDGASVTVATGYSEPVTVAMDQVAGLTTDHAVRLHLAGGDTLSGAIGGYENGRFLVQHPVLGAVPVPAEALVAVPAPAEATVSAPDLAAEECGPCAEEAMVDHEDPDFWSGALTVGGHYETGNNDRSGVNGDVRALRDTGKDRVHIQLQYNYEVEDDAVTEKNLFGLLKYDYFFREKSYWYLASEIESDEFKDLDLRATAGAGLGHRFLDTEKVRLELEAGLAHQWTMYDNADDTQELTARAGLNLDWKLHEKWRVADRLLVYPSLEEADYTLRNEASLIHDINAHWALKLCHILEYDSAPVDDKEDTDSTWIAGVSYKF